MDDADHPFSVAMGDSTEDSSEEPTAPDCQVTGCDRVGTVPRKLPSSNTDEPLSKHYVCRYHHRLFLAVKGGIALLVIVVFVIAFFQF